MSDKPKPTNGQYSIDDWSEEVLIELPSPQKLSKARIKMTFTGELTGSVESHMLMSYIPDGSAYYSAMLYFKGTIAGKNGSFIIIEDGEHKDNIAYSRWRIAEGSGTDGLKGIKGSGGYQAGHCDSIDYFFECEF